MHSCKYFLSAWATVRIGAKKFNLDRKVKKLIDSWSCIVIVGDFQNNSIIEYNACLT